MHLLLELVRHPAAGLLGKVLLHFLWQGTVVAALLALMLAILRRASANVRYLLACAALGMMAALPLLTWLWLRQPVEMLFAGSAIQLAAATPLPQTIREMALRTAPSPWQGWLLVGWLAGVLALGFRLTGGWWHVQQLRRREVTLANELWIARLETLRVRLGLARPVQLLESARLATPLVLGWLRPVILLPVGFVASLSPAQVDAILAHELAHLRRHDFVVNLLQRLVEVLLFYHPAVWWVSEQIRIERENCCDDMAAEVLGSRRVMAEALISLAERQTRTPELAFAADGGSVSSRVRRLLGVTESGGGLSGGGLLVALLLAAGFGAGAFWVLQRSSKSSLAAPTEMRDPRAGLATLTNRLAELTKEIALKQTETDQLQIELGLPVNAVNGESDGSLDIDQLKWLIANRAELETRLASSQSFMQGIDGKAQQELRYFINVHGRSPLLQTLLNDLQIWEQKKAQLSPDFGPKHVEVVRVDALLAKLNSQIEAVVRGVVDSVETQIKADQLALKEIEAKLEAAKLRETETVQRFRPYLRAKRDLEILHRMREVMVLKVMQESLDVELAGNRNQ